MTTFCESAARPAHTGFDLRCDLRAAAVFLGAVTAGGVGGFALTELLGIGGSRWSGSELSAIASAVGALTAGRVARRSRWRS
jgi:hypothetical protein